MTNAGSSHPIRSGDLVAGKYRVDRVLGEGGMGVVVAATHEALDQRVALKFLLPAMASNPEVVQRFLREARAAVKIHSEHVARVLDVGTHDGAPYMVMEYLEGGDLASVLAERGRLPIGEAVGIILQASEAIAEAHALGIVHRDLKPANLFLARRPTGKSAVKVLDFGISKSPAAAGDANLTRTSALMGSPSYMSPEQLVSAATVDARADIWALGVVLYEMLTGALPFTADSMPELVGTILQHTPAPVASLREGLPAGVQGVVDRCLQKSASDRFAHVAELARALLPFGPSRSEDAVERIEHVLGVPPGAAPVALTGPAVAPPTAKIDPSTFSPATSQAEASGARGRKRLVAWLIFGLALVGFAVTAPLLLRGARPVAVAPSATARSAAAPAVASALAAMLASSSPPPAPADADAPSASVESVAVVPEPAVVVAPPSADPAHAKVPLNATRSSPKPVAPPTAPATSTAPACRTVSYFDTDGNKHFKQECR